MRRKLLITLLMVSAAAGPAQAQEPPAADVEIQDGIRVVHNQAPFWGNEPKVSLEFIQRIGDLETDDEHYQFFRPSDVVRGEDGSIFVLENGSNQIKVYTADGVWKQSLSHQGQGPGEINGAFTMDLASDGTLHVCDFTNLRIQVITPEGDPVRSVRMGGESGKRFTSFRLDSEGDYLARTAPILYPNEPIEEAPVLNIFGAEGQLTGALGGGMLTDYGDFAISVFLSVHTYDVDAGDNACMSFAYQNRIEKYGPDGTLLFRADRPLAFTPAEGGATIDDLTLVSNAIATDPRGRIWVTTATRIATMEQLQEQEESEEPWLVLDLFDPEGVLLARMPMPVMANTPPIPPIATPANGFMRIFGDRLYFVDMLNGMCVYEYRIVEAG